MRLLLVLSLGLAVFASFTAANPAEKLKKSLLGQWEHFVKQHGKSYQNAEEEALRRSIWLNNLEFINKHNAEVSQGKHTFTMGMNKYGDLTHEEFKSRLRYVSQNKPLGKLAEFKTKIPDSVDWRTKGCVEGVRDESQGCNDLYAFGASESLGGIFCAKTGKMTPLSAQQILDCSTSFGNMGCEGGYITQSFLYIQAAPGADSKASYPDGSGARKCAFNPANVVCSDSGYVSILKGNETALTAAIANIGPVSVAINAGQSSFQFYQSGVYYDPSCDPDDLDFMILLVGYGSLSGADYYIGKNSWGVGWGMNGYVMMARNRNNNCGIASDANYPILA